MRTSFYLAFSLFLFLQTVVSGQISAPPCSSTGVVVLRVDFLASGDVGEITVVKGLPDGLNESAIAAARTMKFEPKKVDGKAVNVTRQIEYTFTPPTFDEGSPELKSEAVITSIKQPKFPSKWAEAQTQPTIEVTVALHPKGKAEIVEIKGEFPPDIKYAVRKAVSKILYKPAIHRCGEAVSQTKKIQYQVK